MVIDVVDAVEVGVDDVVAFGNGEGVAGKALTSVEKSFFQILKTTELILDILKI